MNERLLHLYSLVSQNDAIKFQLRIQARALIEPVMISLFIFKHRMRSACLNFVNPRGLFYGIAVY